jgi:hypothetical protein
MYPATQTIWNTHKWLAVKAAFPQLVHFANIGHLWILGHVVGMVRLYKYWPVWHLEDCASWYILIMKANEMHDFSDLFAKVLCTFRTCSRLLACSRADANRTSMTNTYCVYTVFRYSWFWTADMSETCRVLYQMNLRNRASRWLSL